MREPARRGRRRLGRRPRHRRAPRSAGEAQSADRRGRADRARARRDRFSRALERHPLFLSAALPRRIYPPMFNRYDGADGMQFGSHVDGAVRLLPGTGVKIRTDISATLFSRAPEDYDGGELHDRRHLRRAQRQAAGRRPGALSGDQPCIASRRSRAARGSRRSSGCRAWCATTRSGRCCSISTWRSCA